MKKNPTQIKSLAVLCSGGDAPGMNAAVRSVVRTGISRGLEVYGIYRGYAGLLEGQIEPLYLRSVANIIQRGGTILKTARCPAFHRAAARREAANLLQRKGIDALIVIGGDGSYAGAHLLRKENDFPVVGLPGTIDNDIYGSDYTIGFDTAVNTAVDAIDKIRDTASSHDRIFLVEVMGRTSLEIATRVAVCGGAEMVYVPGRSGEFDRTVEQLELSRSRGKMSSIIIVAEGKNPGHSEELRVLLKKRAKMDARVVVLGHIQRGGSPTAMDRFMASAMGAYAVQSLLAGHSGAAVSLQKGELTMVPFPKIFGRHKKPDEKLLKLVQILAN
jgi:6-phosphofructokinase 1